MASHANLYTVLGNASNQYVTGSGLNVPHRDRVEHIDLINLVFRVLEIRGVLIPQDPVGYDRCPMITRDPNYDLVVDYPDVYYIQDPGRYTGYYMTNPNPRGYFRDMLEYACSNKHHGLLKRLLTTQPARFEGGRRPSLQDSNEIKHSAEAVNLEAVRVLLAADRDWKIGTDPHTGWSLPYIQGVEDGLHMDLVDFYKADDLSRHNDIHIIQRLLIQDKRNL
jgi:hypothetical protein